MEMKVSDQTDLSCMAGLPAESVIEVAAIIKATAVIRMAVGLHTTQRGATPILDADKVILNEGPIPGILPTRIHPGDIPVGPDLHQFHSSRSLDCKHSKQDPRSLRKDR